MHETASRFILQSKFIPPAHPKLCVILVLPKQEMLEVETKML